MAKTLREILRDIKEQATRKNRAVDLKKYLVYDLDRISELSDKAKEELKRVEEINNKYGVFFDKVISDGIEPEAAARELDLL